MKHVKSSLFLGAFLGSLLASGPALSADLLEVYRLAQQNDPEIAAAQANFLAASEARPQARAAYLPQIELTADYTLVDELDRTADETAFVEEDSPPILIPDVRSFRDSDGWSATLSLRQTIFNWGRIKDINRASADVAQAEAEYNAALQQLIVRVAERYFDLLAAQDSLEASQINRESIGRQLDQARKRFEVGLIAITDVQESQAAFDQATAEVIAAERTANSTRENLRAIIGQYIDEVARPVSAMPLTGPQPESADAWVERALEQNLSVIANRFAVESAEVGRETARAGHYPSLDLVAQRTETDGATRSQFRGIEFPETTAESTRDYVGLQLRVPIFSGGTTQSQVRQAAHRATAARSTLTQAMRNAESQARDTYLGVISDVSRVEALRQAYQSSQTALKATQAGYDVGTRTAVDVLAARRNELQALVNFQRARYDYILNTLRLKQAAGTLTSEDVAEVARWME